MPTLLLAVEGSKINNNVLAGSEINVNGKARNSETKINNSNIYKINSQTLPTLSLTNFGVDSFVTVGATVTSAGAASVCATNRWASGSKCKRRDG